MNHKWCDNGENTSALQWGDNIWGMTGFVIQKDFAAGATQIENTTLKES